MVIFMKILEFLPEEENYCLENILITIRLGCPVSANLLPMERQVFCQRG
jgi:hypothetical protein